eukprot:3596240-Amphidinium_carterae.1
MKWALQQKVDSDSPSTGWNLGWIERSLANEREMSFLAREVKDYPHTIKDLTTWVLTNVVLPILPDVKAHADEKCLATHRVRNTDVLQSSSLAKQPVLQDADLVDKEQPTQSDDKELLQG